MSNESIDVAKTETNKPIGPVDDASLETYYVAPQWKLVWWKFRKHKVSMIAGVVLILMYLVVIFCEVLSPHTPLTRFPDHLYAKPTKIRMIHEGKLVKPFIYGLERTMDRETFRRYFVEDREARYPVRLFIRGEEYKLWGLFTTKIHIIGAEGHPLLLFGADRLGRDVFSRIIYGSRISLTVGLVGIFFTFIFGLTLGGLSGYLGGVVDTIIQRTIDLLISIPTLPLWMALAAALPRDWPPLRLYFGIVIIFSVINWTGLARVVRGKLLSLREEDFVLAAEIAGASHARIIGKHLIPSFSSYIIVSLTLSVPAMILGETALSFLGLGLQPPVVSWGTLLQDAQSIQAIAHYPWLLLPCAFVIVSVLMFNFLGDGLRDSVDPLR